MTTTDDFLRLAGEGPDDEWLPEHCPSWCDGGHKDALVEGCGWKSSQDHVASGGAGVLDEMRNTIDGRVTRPGGGSWELTARQTPMPRHGLLTIETIVLRVGERLHKYAEIPLSTGEARVLARQLTALADRIDLT